MDPINVLEYETLAREKLPAAVYDFIAGGADDEITLRQNRAAFERIQIRPRVLVDVSSVETSANVLGQAVSFPVMLAPAGGQRLAHVDGELASARAAAALGTVFALSTTSSYSIEEVAQASKAPKWFQLHFSSDRELTKDLVQRAEANDYGVLCVTVDMQGPRNLERTIRNPPEFVSAKNLGEHLGPRVRLSDPALSWKDIEWLGSLTSMRIVLKGILTPEDARRAVEHGIAGVVVSNHGGRELDTVPASIDVLAEVVEAVKDEAEVLLDGGVRRGTDVLKALALGAKAVLIGRPYLWGLAVDGEAGVRRVLELLRRELESAMALAGCPSVGALNGDFVRFTRSREG